MESKEIIYYKQVEEALAFLRTLASFGGTSEQARLLAQKGIDRINSIGETNA